MHNECTPFRGTLRDSVGYRVVFLLVRAGMRELPVVTGTGGEVPGVQADSSAASQVTASIMPLTCTNTRTLLVDAGQLWASFEIPAMS